jgi:hypothetical protein
MIKVNKEIKNNKYLWMEGVYYYPLLPSNRITLWNHWLRHWGYG